MRIRTLTASALVALGVTAGICGTAAAGEPDHDAGRDGERVVVTCEDGAYAVRAAVPADRVDAREGGHAVRGRVAPAPDARPVEGEPCTPPLVASRADTVPAVPAVPAR